MLNRTPPTQHRAESSPPLHMQTHKNMHICSCHLQKLTSQTQQSQTLGRLDNQSQDVKNKPFSDQAHKHKRGNNWISAVMKSHKTPLTVMCLTNLSNKTTARKWEHHIYSYACRQAWMALQIESYVTALVWDYTQFGLRGVTREENRQIKKSEWPIEWGKVQLEQKRAEKLVFPGKAVKLTELDPKQK